MENTKSKAFLQYSIGGTLIAIVVVVVYVFIARPEIRHHKLVKCVGEVGKEDFLNSNNDPEFESAYERFRYETSGDSLTVTTSDPELKKKVDICYGKYGK